MAGPLIEHGEWVALRVALGLTEIFPCRAPPAHRHSRIEVGLRLGLLPQQVRTLTMTN